MQLNGNSAQYKMGSEAHRDPRRVIAKDLAQDLQHSRFLQVFLHFVLSPCVEKHEDAELHKQSKTK
jgi:hypothetical protein